MLIISNPCVIAGTSLAIPINIQGGFMKHIYPTLYAIGVVAFFLYGATQGL
jgi:hypothetical protein